MQGPSWTTAAAWLRRRQYGQNTTPMSSSRFPNMAKHSLHYLKGHLLVPRKRRSSSSRLAFSTFKAQPNVELWKPCSNSRTWYVLQSYLSIYNIFLSIVSHPSVYDHVMASSRCSCEILIEYDIMLTVVAEHGLQIDHREHLQDCRS